MKVIRTQKHLSKMTPREKQNVLHDKVFTVYYMLRYEEALEDCQLYQKR